MAKKQKINRTALIQMAIFLVVIFAAIAWVFNEEIRQSFSAKTVCKGTVTEHQKKSFSGVGSANNRLSQTTWFVAVELEENAGRVITGKEEIYNKSELNQTYYVLWRNYDNEILDIAADEASLNMDAGDNLSVWELLLTAGLVPVLIVLMFLWKTKAKRK